MNWMNRIPNELRLKAILYIPLILSNLLNVTLRPQRGFPGKTCPVRVFTGMIRTAEKSR
jgi:hypothetical protein